MPVLVESNRRENQPTLRLKGEWFHPIFFSFDQIEWWERQRNQTDDCLELLWDGCQSPVIKVQKETEFFDSGCWEYLIAKVDPRIAGGVMNDKIVVSRISEWLQVENDGDGLCREISECCKQAGLSTVGFYYCWFICIFS